MVLKALSHRENGALRERLWEGLNEKPCYEIRIRIFAMFCRAVHVTKICSMSRVTSSTKGKALINTDAHRPRYFETTDLILSRYRSVSMGVYFARDARYIYFYVSRAPILIFLSRENLKSNL